MTPRLVLPFDTDDPEFSRGVQIGILWAQLDLAGYVDGALIYDRNAEMVMRIAEVRGVEFSAQPAGSDWLSVTLGRPPHAET